MATPCVPQLDFCFQAGTTVRFDGGSLTSDAGLSSRTASLSTACRAPATAPMRCASRPPKDPGTGLPERLPTPGHGAAAPGLDRWRDRRQGHSLGTTIRPASPDPTHPRR